MSKDCGHRYPTKPYGFFKINEPLNYLLLAVPQISCAILISLPLALLRRIIWALFCFVEGDPDSIGFVYNADGRSYMRKRLLVETMAINIEKVRIIVVGDSGVGKTCLTHLIACNESLIRPGWTVGCNIEVKLHEYKEGTPQQQPYYIELFDIGGSLNHKNTRGVFYTPTHGIILVHDLTNRKSQENLLEWLFEILNKEGKDTYKPSSRITTAASYLQLPTSVNVHQPSIDTNGQFDLEEFLGSTQIPILVVGTKLDLIDEKRQPKTLRKTGGIAEQCGAEEIWLNCRDTRSLAAGTTDAVKLSRFFDCVIEKRMQTGGVYNGSSTAGSHITGSGISDRRRYAAPIASSHTGRSYDHNINLTTHLQNATAGGDLK